MEKFKEILKNLFRSFLHILWIDYCFIFNKAKKPINVYNILLIHFIGIGNMIFFTPTIKEIRKYYPQAKITILIGSRGPEEVIKGSEYVDKIIIFDIKRDKNIIRLLRLIRKLRKYNFDISISSPTSFLGALICFLSNAKYRIAHYYKFGWFNESACLYSCCIKEDENLHEVERNLSLLKLLGIVPNFKISVFFHIDTESVRLANNFLKINRIIGKNFLIGIHPGCSQDASYRRWPMNNFIKLGNLLIKHFGAKLIIFGGPEEEELVRQIYCLMTIKPIISIKKTLKQTATVIEKCNLFINTDSGLGHIATALGVPTITIYGPANSVRTKPWGKNCIVVKKDYECMPCYLKRGQKIKCDSFRCIKDISVDMVISEVSKFIEKQ